MWKLRHYGAAESGRVSESPGGGTGGLQRRATLNLGKILAELKSERDSINHAIALLAKIKSIKKKRTVIRARRGGMTPAGRKRLSEAMKKRWAEKRKKRA
jgi:hypothetical protein